MNHQEIRFNILYILYNKHYSKELGHPQSTSKIIEETELKNIDKHIVYGDVVYLEQAGDIKSLGDSIGDIYPHWIEITNYGIDKVDNITNNIIKDIGIDNENIDVPPEIKTLSTEQNPKNKITRFWEYVKANPTFFANTIEKILKNTLGGGGTL